MDYFPLFLDLKNQPCLVVGGGDVATRKIAMLRRAHASVTVIAPTLSDELRTLATKGLIAFINDNFHDDYLTRHLQDNQAPAPRYKMVVAATNDEQVNAKVAVAARAHQILVNVVDAPQYCDFIMPAIVDRSPLIIAIGSSGQVPVLTRLMRRKIETWVPTQWGDLAKFAGSLRTQIKAAFADTQARRRFWERLLEGEAARLALNGQIEAANTYAQSCIQDPAKPEVGCVYLVGSGPGDPDLLTLRALRLMQQADVVLYDNLVSDAIMDKVRRDAERIYVGKVKSNHTLPQEDINALMARLAHEGKRVLRLKGGDPFMFGRGGEELAHLVEAGIAFEVVPGITAASGAAAYAGIPLTHRDHAHACLFITGHRQRESDHIDWQNAANAQHTVVVYMGIGEAAHVSERIIHHGRAPDTPVAIIERATTPKQRTVISTLANLSEAINQASIQSPALLIIGTVVTLHHDLNWFYPQNSVLMNNPS